MQPPLPLESQLIADIYRTAIDRQAWVSVMAGLVQALDGRSARLLLMNPDGDQVRNSIKFNIDDSYHAPYVQHYVNLCPWRPELQHKPKGLLYSTFLDFTCRQTEFRRTEFYTDWARPQGIEHGLCGTVYTDGQQEVQLLVQRTREPGHFTREQQAFVNGLLPHIRQSLLLSQLLSAPEAELGMVKSLMARHNAFLLLNAQLQVRFVSPGAETFLSQHPLLKVVKDQLQAVSTAMQGELDQHLANALATASGHGRRAGGEIRLGNLLLRVMPVTQQHQHSLLSVTHAAVAVVLQSRPQLRLTPREHELALALVQGDSLETHAQRRGISRETVRSQLKSLFSKTDTHRQHELVVALLQAGISSST